MVQLTAFDEAEDIVNRLVKQHGVDIKDVSNDDRNQVLTIATSENAVDKVVDILSDTNGNFGLRMTKTKGYPVVKIYKDPDDKLPYIFYYCIDLGFDDGEMQSVIDVHEGLFDDLRSPAEVRSSVLVALRTVSEVNHSDPVSFERLGELNEDDLDLTMKLYQYVGEQMS